MFKVAIGHSEDPDTLLAVEDIIKQCRATLGNVKPQAGLLFASVSYDIQKLLEAIRGEFIGIELVGCSSFGEISSKIGVSLDSAALMLFASDTVSIKGGLAQNVSDLGFDQTDLNEMLPKQNGFQNPEYCCLLADGIAGNVSKSINGLRAYFADKNLPISGGAACDNWEFKKTFQFYNHQIASDAASFLVFTHPLKISTAVTHGRDNLGSTIKHKVTKSNKNVIYTINGKTALDFYKEAIGDVDNRHYALLFYRDNPAMESIKYMIRSPLASNKEDGSVVCGGEIPEDYFVTISQPVTQAKTLGAARVCVNEALANFKGDKIHAALVFSCGLRREILGTNVSKEFELIQEGLPKDLPIFGFYTYGEIGAIHPSEGATFHNETIIITLLGE